MSAGEFIPAVTGSSHAVCHFYHNEFERCRILDKHLALLAKKYFKTRFVKARAAGLRAAGPLSLLSLTTLLSARPPC